MGGVRSLLLSRYGWHTPSALPSLIHAVRMHVTLPPPHTHRVSPLRLLSTSLHFAVPILATPTPLHFITNHECNSPAPPAPYNLALQITLSTPLPSDGWLLRRPDFTTMYLANYNTPAGVGPVGAVAGGNATMSEWSGGGAGCGRGRRGRLDLGRRGGRRGRGVVCSKLYQTKTGAVLRGGLRRGVAGGRSCKSPASC